MREERPHPGAQLHVTHADGLRVTAFATNTARGQLAVLELRTVGGPAAKTGSGSPRTPA